MSLHVLQRLKGYYERSAQLAPYIRPSFFSPVYFASRHFMPKLLFKGQYGRYKFFIRNIDYSAIREIFFEGDYDFLIPLLKQGRDMCVLDVGAHIGIFSLWLLNQNQNIRIVSIEASKETYDILLKTAEGALKEFGTDWKCLYRAAWKNNDTLSFSGGGDAMSHQVDLRGDERVQGISFNDLMSLYDGKKIDLMKVDIEGAEESFLCESPKNLEKVDRLIVELHAKYCDTKRVRELLESIYPHISEVQGRASSKVVLYCRREICQ